MQYTYGNSISLFKFDHGNLAGTFGSFKHENKIMIQSCLRIRYRPAKSIFWENHILWLGWSGPNTVQLQRPDTGSLDIRHLGAAKIK